MEEFAQQGGLIPWCAKWQWGCACSQSFLTKQGLQCFQIITMLHRQQLVLIK